MDRIESLQQSLNHKLFFYFFCLLLLAAFAILFQHLYILWSYTVDDAYISFRYAYNFEQQGKMLWNVGQLPIEGYTSMLHVLWLSLGFLLHAPILLWAKITGVLSILGVGLIFFRSVLIEKSPLFTAILILLYAFFLIDMPTAIHTVEGLETGLYLFLFFSTILSFSSVNHTLNTHESFLWQVRLFSLLVLLSGLTRPEANLYNAIFLCASFFNLDKYRRGIFIKSIALIYILPSTLYFIWRADYYHTLFPLPFYIKFNNGSFFPGLADAGGFLCYYFPLILSMFSCWVLAFKTRKMIVITYAIVFLSGLLFTAQAAPIMNHSFRFAWPLIALVLASGWLIRSSSAKAQAFSVVLLLSSLAIFTYKNQAGVVNEEIRATRYAKGLSQAHVALGKSFGTVRSDRALVTSDAGAISFYSNWPVIDSFGLNDKTLATKQFSSTQKVDYILAQDPRVIILISNSSKKMQGLPELQFQKALYDRALGSGMSLLTSYKFQDGYYLLVLGHPNDEELVSALTKPF